MSFPPSLSSRFWLVAALCALGFVVWLDYQRIQRVEYVTNTDREEAVLDASSPTGYAGGQRWAIVPEHNNRSYQWIAETQQMLATQEWRVRQINYENAPDGREVHSASLYRWWLGLIAWSDHVFSGRPTGVSVERAALFAEPLLHWLFLAGTTIFAARYFGPFAATLMALGLATIYPFAGGFLPGVPDDQSLSRICAVWSVLPLLAWAGGVNPSAGERKTTRLFLLAGIAGGVGLWVSAVNQTPVIVAIALGGFLAACLASRKEKTILPGAPWRQWALGGAIASFAAYLVEYFPAHLDFRLEVNHPLYAIAWLGVGELLERFTGWKHDSKKNPANRITGWLVVTASVAAIAALPLAMRFSGSQNLFTGDLSSSRLTYLPDGAIAKNLGAWMTHDGFTGAVVAACLPILLLAPVLWLITRRQTTAEARRALAFGLGPVAVSLVFACFQLRWFNLFDGLSLSLLITVSAIDSPSRRWLWAGCAGLFFLPGAVQLLTPVRNG